MSDDKDTPVEEVEKAAHDEPPAEITPPPVQEPEQNKDDIKSTLDNIVERVTGLENAIATVVPVEEQDTPPGGKKQPWTHRRWF